MLAQVPHVMVLKGDQQPYLPLLCLDVSAVLSLLQAVSALEVSSGDWLLARRMETWAPSESRPLEGGLVAWASSVLVT